MGAGMSNDIANMGSGLNTTGIQQASAALKELLSASQQIGQLAKDFQAVGISITVMNVQLAPSVKNVDQLGAGLQKTEGEASKAAAAVSRLIANIKSKISVTDVIDMADNWGQMSYRIQQTVNSQAEYNTVMARTAASARETSRDVDEVRELYLQVGESIQGLGYSLLESMDLTDSFSLLLKTNSASAEESAAATNAYAAALQKGGVDAKDWETMLAAMPSLVDQIADSTGMSAEEIKRLGSEGKLALQDINQGMFDSLESTRALSTEMPDTVRGALTNVMSGLKDFVGAQNEAFGVTQVLAGGLNLLADHIDVAGKVAAAVGVVMGARYVGSLQSSASAMVVAAAQAVRLQVATVSLAASVSPVSALLSVLRGGMALLGGPVGLAITVLAGATAAFFAFRDGTEKASASLDGFGQSAEDAQQTFKNLTESQRLLTLSTAEKNITDNIDALDASYKRLVKTAAMTDGSAPMLKWQQANGAAIKSMIEQVKAGELSYQDFDAKLSEMVKTYAQANGRSEAWVQAMLKEIGASSELAEKVQNSIGLLGRLKQAYDLLRVASDGAVLGAGAGRGFINPETVEQTTKRLSEETAAVLQSTSAYRSRTEAIAEVQADAANVNAALQNLKAKGLGDSEDAAKLEARLEGVNERLRSMTNAGSGAAAGVETAASSFAKWTAAIAEKISTTQADLDGTNKLNESQKLQLKLNAELASGKSKLTQESVAKIEADIRELDGLERLRAETERSAKAYEAWFQERQAAVNSVLQQANGMEDSNKKLRDEIELIGKSAEEQKKIIRGREEQKLATAELHLEELRRNADATQHYSQELYAQERLVDAMRENLTLFKSKDVAEANAAAQKEIAANWNKTSEQIGKTLSDFIMGGGKDAAKYLKNLFNSLVLQPIVNYGVQGVMGMLGGGHQGTAAAAVGAGGQFGMPAGGFTNWGSWGGNLSSSLNNMGFQAIGNGWTSTGEFLSNLGETVGRLDTWLKDIPGFKGGIGSAAGYAAAIFSVFQGNYGQGLGTAIGTFILPGIGTMIGGFLGGMLDGVFGRKLKDVGIGGTYSAQEGLDAYSYKYYKGGWFRGNKTKTEALDEEAAGPIQSLFDSMLLSVAGFADALSIQADALSAFSYSFKFSTNGKTEAEIQEAIADVLNSAAIKAADSLNVDYNEFARGGETSIETLSRLAGSLVGVNTLFDVLGHTLFEASMAGGDMASQLVDMFGGLEGMQAVAGGYLDNFYDEQERIDIATRGLTASFDKLGLTLPTSKEALRELIEAQDLTTEKGREMYAALMLLSGSFSDYTASVENAAQKEKELADNRIAEQQRVIDELYSTAGINGDTIAQILRDGLLGRLTEEDVGAQLSNQIIDGIYNSLAGGFAQQITELFTSGIITPLLQAAATGSVMSGVVSQASIDAVVAQAQASVAALSAILNDPAIQEAIAKLKGVIGDLKIGTPTVPTITRPIYSSGGGGSSVASNAKSDANALISAWKSVYDAILGSMNKLRDSILGTTQDEGNSFYEAQFALLTAQARAGDKEAADKLPDIVSKLQAYALANSTSLFEQNASIAGYIQSLEATQQYVAGFYSAAGGDKSKLQALVSPAIYAPASLQAASAANTKSLSVASSADVLTPMQGSNSNNALLSEMRAMREELAAAKAELQAMRSNAEDTAANTRNIHRTLDEVTGGGEAMLTKGVTA